MILLARDITQRFFNLTNNCLRTSFNTRNQATVQGDRVNIQSRNYGNDGRNTRLSYVQEEIIEGNNVQNNAGNTQRNLRTTSSGTAVNVQCYNCNEKGVILTNEHNDFIFVDASRMEKIEEISVNICLMARIQPANFDSDEGPSYDSAYLSEVQTLSTSYVNPLFAKDTQEQKDTKDIPDDATKIQIKMKKKSQDPIAIEKKQNVWTIDYKKLNALYEDFVPQKEFSAEHKYFSSSFISSENSSNESSPSSSSKTKPIVAPMPSANPMKLDLNKMKNEFQKLFALLQTNSKRESSFYTSLEEIQLTKFCQQE
nr:hypothetical protein [Tanacetum cinerariifolium]